MQYNSDFGCSKCEQMFDSASGLLQHYASHVVEELMLEDKKKPIPDLYPIKKGDSESDSGVEDVNPLKYCLVTMETGQKTSGKKYQCSYCTKTFGWSTDLKRHTLIHTGERPFKCASCCSSFTRNFLLQNHQRKVHGSGRKSKVPQLKPLKVE